MLSKVTKNPQNRPEKKAPVAGEIALISQLRHDFATKSKAIRQGIGDDCAILRFAAGSEVLVTTDFSLEGRHFLRTLHPPESVGHRCLARGLSDLAAMGGTPVAAFLSLALPTSWTAKAARRLWVERFFKGLKTLADLHNVPLAGGDTSESPGGDRGLLLADIVLLGSAPKGKALRRAGASAGDDLYVTGHLGGAAAELAVGLQNKRTARASSTGDHPHFFPEPRVDVGEALLRRGLATACLDISDGLSTDLAHLCRASEVSAEVEETALPIHPLARKLGGASGLQAALHGGEDYELLFSASAAARLPSSLAGVPVTRIGSITQRRRGRPLMTLIRADGERAAIEAAGWEHFAAAKPARKAAKKVR